MSEIGGRVALDKSEGSVKGNPSYIIAPTIYEIFKGDSAAFIMH